MDAKKTLDFVSHEWDSSIVPALQEYIRIPNQSPSFDTNWATNGLLDKAAELEKDWVLKQGVEGLKAEIVRLPNRTPLIFIEIPAFGGANANDTILMYGHLDKQPPLLPWAEGLHPYEPVIKDGKLYGRGGADDGYSIFGAIAAVRAVRAQNMPHVRVVVMIEACERITDTCLFVLYSQESGSPDLPHYVEHLSARIGTPSLIICLDSGAGNYEQWWLTTSLRGMVHGVLSVKILNDGVHSGAASGIVPSTFRIMRMLLARLEDEKTGKVLLPELSLAIPPNRIEEAKRAATVLGNTVFTDFPFVAGSYPMSNDIVELLLNKSWRPTVSYTGAEGFPTIAAAGNVLRSETKMKISIRLPPGIEPAQVIPVIKRTFEQDPPYGAKVHYEGAGGAGWESPALAPWLSAAVERASQTYYKKPPCLIGEGGSIPFMGMLGKRYPKAQFVITGVLGPQSNAHGPNEFLHIDFAKKINCCVAEVIAEHAKHSA